MVSDESSIYMDFKQQPALIRTALEDLLPFTTWDFVEQFYRLIEWVNGTSSLLESNDCTFNPLEDNDDQQYPYAKRCSGRLMILFRDIAENCQDKSLDWLMNNIQSMAASMKPNFNAGAIGLSKSPTCYLALGDKPDTGGMGYQVSLNFFAYGEDEQACYGNLKEVLVMTQKALLRVNMRIKNGEIEALYAG